MFDTAQILTKDFAIHRGIIAGFENGKILVKPEKEEENLPCDFLRTTREPLPPITIRDSVLYVLDADKEQGYILGLVDSYSQVNQENPNKDTLNYPDAQVEVEMPGKLKKVRVSGKTIHIEADDEIQLKCGKGSILINNQGKIVIRGTNLISRSSGMNKIKGAAVNIN